MCLWPWRVSLALVSVSGIGGCLWQWRTSDFEYVYQLGMFPAIQDAFDDGEWWWFMSLMMENILVNGGYLLQRGMCLSLAMEDLISLWRVMSVTMENAFDKGNAADKCLWQCGGYGRGCASRLLGVGVLRLLGDVYSAHFYGMYVCFVNICLLAKR